MSNKFRSFVFTINNYTDDHVESCKSLNYKYILFGYEVAPTTGTKHIQGYVQFKNPISMNSIIKQLPGAHIEPAKGNYQANHDYCTKSEDYFEDGEPPHQGSRSDIHSARALLQETGRMRDVVAEATSYQSIQVCNKYLEYHEKKRDFQPKVYWLYGPTGTGKSHTAKTHCQDDDPYYCGKSNQWWQGYDGHKTVIIDDFRASFCVFNELLRMLDKYPYSIECKGGSRQLLATKMYITSPFHPKDVYAGVTTECKEQLLRRIRKIVHLTTRYQPEEPPSDDEEDDKLVGN